MTENSESNGSAGNELVVYKPHSLDLAKHVQDLQTPIRELNPETRIVSNGSMYAGGFYGIEFDEDGIDGVAYIRFLEALKEGNPAEASLLEKMSRKLFGEQKADDSFLVEHDDRKYRQQWIVRTGNHSTQLFRLNRYKGSVKPTDFPAKLKTRIANERNMLVSNELVQELFAPLFDPVIQTYMQVTRF